MVYRAGNSLNFYSSLILFSLILCFPPNLFFEKAGIASSFFSHHNNCVDCRSLNYTAREWINVLKQQSSSLDCIISKMETQFIAINASNPTVGTIKKKHINNLKRIAAGYTIQRQGLETKCSLFDGDECNVEKEPVLNIIGEGMYLSFNDGSATDKYGMKF